MPAGGNLPLILGIAGGVVVLLGLVVAGVAWSLMSSGPDVANTQTEGGGTTQPGWPNNNGRPIINRPGNNDPAKPQSFDMALTYLKSGESNRRRMALEYLLNDQRVDPARRDQLDKALEPLLEDRAHKKEVLKVIRRWGGKHTMTALEEQMKDHFEWREAMNELAKMKDERAAEMIAEHLDKFTHEDEAARALKKMGKVAEKAAVKYLHHRRAREHVKPLIKEWKTDDETLAEQALEDLESKDRDVKDAAAETLAECKVVEKLQDKAAKALGEHIKETHFDARKKAAKALEKWATADTLDTVHTYLADRYDDEVREAMYRTVLRIKDEKSIPVLVGQLGSKDKVAAAKVLTTYGDKAEKPVQFLLTSNKLEVRAAAVELLSVIGTKESVMVLNKLAKVDPKLKKLATDAVKVIEAREGKEEKKGKEKGK